MIQIILVSTIYSQKGTIINIENTHADWRYGFGPSDADTINAKVPSSGIMDEIVERVK